MCRILQSGKFAKRGPALRVLYVKVLIIITRGIQVEERFVIQLF